MLINFWISSCINGKRTLSYVRDWHDKYSGHGLVVVGVHSPEFEFEKYLDNEKKAMVSLNVTWPVATDNRWWPHKFLIDQNG